jgi:hypothetical protein
MQLLYQYYSAQAKWTWLHELFTNVSIAAGNFVRFEHL